MFSPCYFHVIISIGILESNSLSLSTPSRTKWTLVYLLTMDPFCFPLREELLVLMILFTIYGIVSCPLPIFLVVSGSYHV